MLNEVKSSAVGNFITHNVSILGKFWQEKINGKIFRWNIFLIIIQISLIFYKFNDLPPQIPFYYSLPWGESQLASTSALFLLPTFSIVFLLVNNLLAALFLSSIQLLSRLLIIFSLVFSSFALISLIQIIFLIA